MKKTIAILLAAAGMALGSEPIELSNTPDKISGNTSVYKFENDTFGEDNNVTVAITLNVENLCAVLENASSTVSVFSLQGTIGSGNDITNAAQGMMLDGIASNAPFFTAFGTRSSSELLTTGSYIDLVEGVGQDKEQALSSQKLNWQDYKSITLVLVSNEKGNSDLLQGYLYLLDANNNISSFYGEASNTRVNPGNYGQINVNNAFVEEFEVYNVSLSSDEAMKLGSAMVAASLPEPTTATLSLLALAGLAARRRRR